MKLPIHLFLFCCIALSLCRDVAPQQPHYRDGLHNAEHDDDEIDFSQHTCQELQDLHKAHGNHPLTPYTASAHDKMIQNDLNVLQKSPGNCQDPTKRFLFYAMHADCGWGAEMHWLTVALHAALVTNRTLIILENEPWIYAEEKFCPPGSGTFSCYFEPISSCTARTDEELNFILNGVELNQLPIFTTKTMDDVSDERMVLYSRDLQKQLDFPFFRAMPQKYIKPPNHHLFWFRSQLIGWLLVPTERVLQIVSHRRDVIELEPEQDLIGVHARRGDKAFGSKINKSEMKPLEFKQIYDISKNLALKCGYEGVYTATKDQGYIEYIKERNEKEPNSLLWLHDTNQRRSQSGWSTHELIQNRLNRTQEALDVIADTLILSSFRAFIGAFESNLSRLVAELACAQYTIDMALAFDRPYMVFP